MLLLKWLARARMRRVARQLAAPHATQSALLQTILAKLHGTRIARDLGLAAVHDPDTFRAVVPVTGYPFYAPYIKAIEEGERSVLFRGRPAWIGQTGGTTGQPKPVPIGRDLLRAFRRFNRDMMFRYAVERGHFDLLGGRMFLIAATPSGQRAACGVPYARATWFMARSAPWLVRRRYVPDIAAVAARDPGEKARRTRSEGWRQRTAIRVAAGMTPYLLSAWEHLLDHARELGDPQPELARILPNLRVAFHGGTSFGLYQARMASITGDAIDHRNIYAATETPIAYQWTQDDPGLVPALDAAFLEFLPDGQEGEQHPRTQLINEVETGVPYTLLLTTRGGLLRYRIGDRVMFTSLDPPRFEVMGREQERLDLSDEKLSVEQAEEALAEAGRASGIVVADFVVCPAADAAGRPRLAHQWIIETDAPPADVAQFGAALEATLGARNPRYAELRGSDAILEPPQLTFVPPGTFRRYMESTLTYGQQKVLHLQPDRARITALLAQAGEA